MSESTTAVATTTAQTPRRTGRRDRVAELIWVIAGEDLDPRQVAIFERDLNHPLTGREEFPEEGGEVTVVKGGPPAQVAQTPFVFQKLANGELVRIDDAEAQELIDLAASEKEARINAGRLRSSKDPRSATASLESAQASAELAAVRGQIAAQNKTIEGLKAQLNEAETVVKELKKAEDDRRKDADKAAKAAEKTAKTQGGADATAE